jgi:predicted CXXCH cytochrome family protein
MDTMKKYLKGLMLLLLVGFSTLLFFSGKAAEPGSLRRFHQDVTGCSSCHVPWKGVLDDKCLECHSGGSMERLKPEIKFHQSNRNCVNCHKEHRGATVSITKMDHTLLNENLLCTQCHFDKHADFFGQECRECHLITTWKIRGYRHPSERSNDCYRCHKAPASHSYDESWGLIKESMHNTAAEQQDCAQCHLLRDWMRLKERQ